MGEKAPQGSFRVFFCLSTMRAKKRGLHSIKPPQHRGLIDSLARGNDAFNTLICNGLNATLHAGKPNVFRFRKPQGWRLGNFSPPCNPRRGQYQFAPLNIIGRAPHTPPLGGCLCPRACLTLAGLTPRTARLHWFVKRRGRRSDASLARGGALLTIERQLQFAPAL
jgi:hypothetical protein